MDTSDYKFAGLGRRSVARIFDFCFWQIVFFILFRHAVGSASTEDHVIALVLVILLPIICYFVSEGIMIHLFGFTLGKLITGLRVLTTDGRKLSLKESFKRAGLVLIAGQGLFVTIFLAVGVTQFYMRKGGIWENDSVVYERGSTAGYITLGILGTLATFVTAAIFIVGGIGSFAVSLVPHTGDISKREFYDNYVPAVEVLQKVTTNDLSYARYVDLPYSDTFEVLTDRNGDVYGFICTDYIYFGSAWSEKQFARLAGGIADLYLSQGGVTYQDLQDLIFVDFGQVWEHPYWTHDIEARGIHLVSSNEDDEGGSYISFTVTYE
ncbi:MAG: RDD family protein [Clostridiales bacterium]|nr:RDD family protein [Clostridiales bacterium]